MAQTLSGVQVTSKVTGTMASTGTNILNDIRMGQSFTTALSATYADIMYSVKLTAGADADGVTWNLDTHRFTAFNGDTVGCVDKAGQTFGGYQAYGGTSWAPKDIEGNALPTATSIAAIMYVTDHTNINTITVDCSNEIFGNVILRGHDTGGSASDKNTGQFNRSALFLPRASPTGVSATIVFTKANDDVTLTFIGKS